MTENTRERIILELKGVYQYDKKTIEEIAKKYGISFQLAELYWNYRNE